MKTIGNNILKAIGIAGYFFVLMLAYQKMNTDRLIGDIEVFSGMFLVLGIIMLEVAYKKDNGKSAISAIELLVLAIHSLSIMHVIKFFKYNFNMYLMISAGVCSGYYVVKAIIENTIEKRKSLKQLSDISEIVKEEPIKKEAKRKYEDAEKNNEKQQKTNNKDHTLSKTIKNTEKDKNSTSEKGNSKNKEKDMNKNSSKNKKIEKNFDKSSNKKNIKCKTKNTEKNKIVRGKK